jgi:hypothetical protein
MGLVESTLRAETVKPIVRADTITPLPSLTIDTCKFTDGTFGFLIQTIDLAKNLSVYSVPFKQLYCPIENVYTYVGKDQTILSFSKDIRSGNVFCILNKRGSSGPVICDCVSTYEPIGDQQIDMLSKLFITKS